MPQAQLRLRIPPGEERGLLVCYRPSEIALQRDTMILGDYCRRILFLESVGTANNFNGNTRCNVPIRSTTLQIGTVGLYIFPAYPNPAGSEINIPMIVKNGNESIEIELFDMLGTVAPVKSSIDFGRSSTWFEHCLFAGYAAQCAVFGGRSLPVAGSSGSSPRNSGDQNPTLTFQVPFDAKSYHRKGFG